MAEQTAIEELIDEIDQLFQCDKSNYTPQFILGVIRLKCLKKLKTEEKQIQNAWDRGQYIGQSFPGGQIEPEYEQDAEEYYYATYKNK
jgi:hypothetical protein